MRTALFVCTLLLSEISGVACGISGGVPSGHIEGCNDQGYVLIAEKLTALSVPGEESTIDVYATFDSSRRRASPYFGIGWSIPFLECNLVQVSEDYFRVVQPDGWKRLFRRVASGSGELDGGGGWRGQLSANHATLWAACGWRLEFHNGKIVQIKTPHGKVIAYNYLNERLQSVICESKTLCSVQYDGDEGAAETLTFDGQHCSIKMVECPQVETIAGKNVITSRNVAFGGLYSGTIGLTRNYEYGVDSKVRPQLTFSGTATRPTTVCWDPGTRRIVSYGDWTYDVRDNPARTENATIARTNPKGQTESWFNDPDGLEVLKALDGSTLTTKWFSTGVLAGKTRSVERIQNNIKQVVYKASYNENGSLQRVETKDSVTYYDGRSFPMKIEKRNGEVLELKYLEDQK